MVVRSKGKIRELIINEYQKIFWSGRNILYFDFSDGYVIVYVCENLYMYYLLKRMDFVLCKVYFI